MTRREEIAWAAGLFEGEGCVTNNDGKPVLRLNMTDREIVERFVEVIRCGKVLGPYQSSSRSDGYKRAPMYVWVCPRAEVENVFALLAPWLGSYRHRRAAEVGIAVST